MSPDFAAKDGRTGRREKKSAFGISVGASSILVIFVILGLTTFATLSLLSAGADARLSARAVQASVDYYAADSRAEEILAGIDGALREAGKPGVQRADYYDACVLALSGLEGVTAVHEDGAVLARYTVPAGEIQALAVEILVNPPGAAKRFVRRSWKLVNTAEWEAEEGPGVWSGDMMFE